MLVNWSAPQHVYIVCGKTDLWKGIDGLAMVIAENYGLELDNDSLFLFCGNRNDRFKGLYWEGISPLPQKRIRPAVKGPGY